MPAQLLAAATSKEEPQSSIEAIFSLKTTVRMIYIELMFYEIYYPKNG
jgi:hypothetical protein